MPKETKTKPKDKPKQKLSQKEKFIAYAKENGLDEDSEDFDRLFDKVVKNKQIP